MAETTHLRVWQRPVEEAEYTAFFRSGDVGTPDFSQSFCANSDLFVHGLFDAPRDLSDEVYQQQAAFFCAGDVL